MTTGSGVAITAGLIANALKAQGVVVEVTPEDFEKIIKKIEFPLVVCAQSKIIRTTHKYLTSYKGLAFYTKSREPISLSSNVERIDAKSLSVPEL